MVKKSDSWTHKSRPFITSRWPVTKCTVTFKAIFWRTLMFQIWRRSFKRTSMCQSCIMFKKFNCSSVHGIELQFISLDKRAWTTTQLKIELFWTEFKLNSERVECHLLKKGWNYRILCIMTKKKTKPSSSSLQGLAATRLTASLLGVGNISRFCVKASG